ncbi:CRISPR-associated protein Csx15 [Pelotomaculum propionicicum]|uniref:Uncharacterized protein n=1 Tax=Pelotomaculum propionicicum TaxID=258475 RepID=A0A4Y7RJM5_9FIRM|nr:CRISPR-associated protein Csx15 [Pelotomaculum propionicicum]TEB09033.1 hypothetical protein Pmgp_03453 [Pelotomaculum propionicicum]
MFLVLINFSHPFTHEQLRRLEELAQKKVERVIEVSAQIDPQQPIVPQIVAMADKTGLTPQEWQTTPLIVNPPSLNISAVTLLAELHGRCGYFPAVARLRPVANSVPPQFEMAEIINLQAVREESRKGR